VHKPHRNSAGIMTNYKKDYETIKDIYIYIYIYINLRVKNIYFYQSLSVQENYRTTATDGKRV